MFPLSPERLQAIEAFKEVPLNQLAWYIDHSKKIVLQTDEMLFESGGPIENTYIVIQGKVRISVMQQNQLREISVLTPDAITGYLPYSRGKVAAANGIALEETHLLAFPRSKTEEMIKTHFELTQALVHQMTTRVREFTALQQQNEKMMALGKLSAGLAHELNNPASAIVRGSQALQSHLQMLPDPFKAVMSIRMTNEEIDVINNLLFQRICSTERPQLSMMERSACEDEIADWLEQHQVPNAVEIAENLVDYGFNEQELEQFKSLIPSHSLGAVMNWVNQNLVTDKMVSDIQEASKRIAELVASVKNYTHMDRAQDKQASDIHQGIRNTLTMLGHKVRKNRIEVVEAFQTDLPKVPILVSEMNQVWTNLLDNAIDVLEKQEGQRLITISTRLEGDFAKINIQDNGPGIPEDILGRIFDPFFTTKEMGKGTGLGLDVVQRIVKQHNGTVRVKSRPGATDFEVCIPMH
ncbi:ATP-binding protein [Cytophagales bacterium LB-30]|uniref:histidine kinase n=1 Tax=Shiella aurantiaca TaxID=3058365 RepID=A0ABT8F7S9_9BACT|nr:ATP-binding protein [Shiella aurantiaca]MDN4166429.1 ATP-binding protein [Shiella aurantiaca]